MTHSHMLLVFTISSTKEHKSRSLRKNPFLNALRRWGRFRAANHVVDWVHAPLLIGFEKVLFSPGPAADMRQHNYFWHLQVKKSHKIMHSSICLQTFYLLPPSYIFALNFTLHLIPLLHQWNAFRCHALILASNHTSRAWPEWSALRTRKPAISEFRSYHKLAGIVPRQSPV